MAPKQKSHVWLEAKQTKRASLGGLTLELQKPFPPLPAASSAAQCSFCTQLVSGPGTGDAAAAGETPRPQAFVFLDDVPCGKA